VAPVASQKVTGAALGRLGREKPPERGFSLKRLKGFEPSTFCMAIRQVIHDLLDLIRPICRVFIIGETGHVPHEYA
jgi:hypothetical protein